LDVRAIKKGFRSRWTLSTQNAEISAEKTGLLSNDDIVSGAAAS